MKLKKHEQAEISFWGNVRRLVQIYLRQCWYSTLYSYSIVIVVFGVFFLTIWEIIHLLHAEDIQSQYVIAGNGGIISIGMMVVLLTSYNAMGDKRTNMFPGNALSHYIARLLADYVLFLGYVLLIGLLYLLQSAVLWLALHGNAGIDLHYLFDVRYLGLGMLHMFLLWMLCHGMLMFLLAVHAKWGNQVMAVAVGVLFLFSITVMLVRSEIIVQLFDWWESHVMENKNFLSYTGFVLVIWFICMVLSFLLVSSMRKLNSTGNAAIGWMGACLWIFTIVIMIGMPETDEDTDVYDARSDLEMERLSGQILMDVGEKPIIYEISPLDYDCVNDSNGRRYGTIGEYFGLDYDYSLTSFSQAYQEGVSEEVDLSGVDEGHILYDFQLPDIRLHGNPVYREWLEGLEEHLLPVEDTGALRPEYHGELKTTLWNDFFPDVDRFLYPGRGEITMDDWYMELPFRVRIIGVVGDGNYDRVMAEED